MLQEICCSHDSHVQIFLGLTGAHVWIFTFAPMTGHHLMPGHSVSNEVDTWYTHVQLHLQWLLSD